MPPLGTPARRILGVCLTATAATPALAAVPVLAEAAEAPVAIPFWAFLTAGATTAALIVALLHWRHRTISHFSARLDEEKIDREQAERQAQAALNKLQNHLEHTPLAVVEFDRDGRITLWTGQATQLFGWLPAETLGQRFGDWSFVHPDDLPAWTRLRANTQGSGILTTRHYARDGRVLLIEWHYSRCAPTAETESILALGMDVTAPYQAEQNLRLEKHRYALAVHAGRAGIWQLEYDSGILRWDDSLKEILGYPARPHSSRIEDWFALLHPEDVDTVRQHLLLCVQGRDQLTDIEVRVRHADTRYLWFLLRFHLDSESHPSGRFVTGTATEITRLKDVQSGLAAAEAKFRALVEQSLAGIFILENGLITYANPRFWSIFGLPPQQSPIAFSDLVVPEERPRFQELSSHWEATTPADTTFLIHCSGPKGTRIAAQGNVNATNLEGRTVIIGLLMDVSERLRQEATMRQLSLVVEQSPVSVMITDPNGVVEYVNPRFTQTTGYSAAEAIGRVPGMLKNSSDETFYQNLWETLRAGRSWESELTNRNKDGRIAHERAQIFPILGNDGKPAHFICFRQDITEQRRLEERLLRTQRLESIGTLAGGIAHDLNNILAPVRLGAEFLRATTRTTKEADMIGMIENSVRRATDLVKQVLTFSRGIRSQKAALHLKHVVRELQQMVQETFPRDIKVEAFVDPQLHAVLSDSTQMLQVFMNLCVNARDAMPDGGLLRIEARNVTITPEEAAPFPNGPGPYVKISVADTGSGIDPAVRDRIFEPFFTTKRPGEGTGLGLATATGIVKSHKGLLDVESEVGKGTTFHVYLPAHFEAPPQEPTHTSPLAIKGQGETILVVEDESALRQTVAFLLQQNGYKVLEAADGVEAIKLLREHTASVALVVLDVMMPRLNGPSAITQLREALPAIPIVATSGLATDERIENLRALGINGFLSKPFHHQELLLLIRKCLLSAHAASTAAPTPAASPSPGS